MYLGNLLAISTYCTGIQCHACVGHASGLKTPIKDVVIPDLKGSGAVAVFIRIRRIISWRLITSKSKPDAFSTLGFMRTNGKAHLHFPVHNV